MGIERLSCLVPRAWLDMALSNGPIRQAVANCLGAEHVSYLANKVRGGDSGRKGTRYEDFFAASKVAELSSAKLAGAAEWPRVQEQVEAFVDDLLIKTASSTKYFQLKNVQSIGWTSGDHPLEEDFRAQKVLCDHLQEPSPSTTLVISNVNLLQSLSAVPPSVAAHSSVEFFPYADGHANRLVKEHQPLRAALKSLSRSANVTDDVLEGVFGVLIIGMMKQNGAEVSVEDVINAARSVSPGFVRLFPDQLVGFKLDDDFVAVLARINGFVYGTERGFFEWSYFDTSGVSSTNCLTREFNNFQRLVVSANPTTFEELEELL